jgi:hypothetical protein
LHNILSFGYCVKIHIYLKNFSSKSQMVVQLSFLPRSSVHKASALLATAISAALLCWTVDAEALSLGRSRGAAVLGRSLDVSVSASMEPKEETPESGCFSAEVFYGETRIGAQNVTITPVRSSPTELAVRVRANTLVDEAFVTVYLRALCGASVSRRYVLLADAPSEGAAAAQVPFAVNNVPAVPTPSGAGSAGGAAAGSFSEDVAAKRKARDERRAALRASQPSNAAAATPEELAAAQARSAARAQAKVQAKEQAKEQAVQRAQERKNKPATSPAAVSQIGKTSTPRLKVDLLDLAVQYEPQLRASSELLSQPTTDLQARAQAAAMWRAINSSPEDLLRDGDRLKAIETDVRAMSELTKQQSKELASLRSDLSQAQRERYANPLVYALGALSLGALAFGIWAWRRQSSRRAPWWGNVSRQEESGFARAGANAQPVAAKPQAAHAAYSSDDLDFMPPSAPAPVAAASASSATLISPPAPFISSRKAAAAVPADFAMSSSAHRTAELVAPAPSANAAVDFGHSAPSAPRSVNAEELFDIQQQADFFMSLGQHSQAIDILQNHISDNVGTSALAYLDLFDIYHKIGQRDDFDALREEFNRVFNAQVPEFDSYGKDSRGLEDYESAMQRIQALWPSAKVLAVIEESIFRMPELDAKPFDLEAYRELMLLYALAKDLSSHDSVIGDLRVDFDLPPGVVEDFSALDSMPTAGSAPASSSSFSPTKVQPLSAAQDVDIDLDIWGDGADVAKTSLKASAQPPASPKAADAGDNMINFEVIQRTDFSRSKNAKL